MPLFGAHMSIAGGCHEALRIAAEHDCDTVQLFTKNSNQWAGKPLTDDDVSLFKKKLREAKLKYPTAHDSYLINLASPDDVLWRKSIEAFVDEVNRAERLGLSYLSPTGGTRWPGEKASLSVAAAIDERSPPLGFKMKILLEATAGRGALSPFSFLYRNREAEDWRLAFAHFFANLCSLDRNF